METYHKINAPYKRHREGPDKGKFIRGEWSTPELEYLADLEWEFTEKVDGTNIRIKLRLTPGGNVVPTFGGRTDNAVIPWPLMEYLEATFYNGHEDHSKWMLDNDLKEVVLYGEGYGPKIQSGGKYRDTPSFVLFDVNIGGFWLDRANVDDVASNLGIDSVPVIGYGTLYDAMDAVMADGHEVYTTGDNLPSNAFDYGLSSQWGDFEAEGIVARPVVPLFNRKGERIIVKIKGVDFK